MNFNLLVCIFFTQAYVHGQVVFLGKCPVVTLQQDFQPDKYFTGKWYEQKRFFAIFEFATKCVTAKYQLIGENDVAVNNSAISRITGRPTFALGEGQCDQDMPAACKVKFSSDAPYGTYNVLASDPEKYGLVYSCTDFYGLFNMQYAWILTREREVEDADLEPYVGMFNANGVDTRWFSSTIQNCPNI